MSEILNKEKVIEALKEVYDPEIPVNIVDLGLIYEVDINNGEVDVKMTLTAAGCGMGPYIAQQAEWAISELDEVEDVNVDIYKNRLTKIVLNYEQVRINRCYGR